LNNLWSFKSCIFWWTTTSGDLQLLMRCFWWTCFWWRHHFRSTLSSGVLWLHEHFSSDALNFLFVDSFALFCSFRTYWWSQILSMVLYIWTSISISNWQFLIPCYHQNSKETVLTHFVPTYYEQVDSYHSLSV